MEGKITLPFSQVVEVMPRGELDNLVDTCLVVELPFDCQSLGTL